MNLAEEKPLNSHQIKQFLIELGKELSPESDTDLLNIKDEMLAEVNKLAYLLTLE
jgi:hypothetical protein